MTKREREGEGERKREREKEREREREEERERERERENTGNPWMRERKIFFSAFFLSSQSVSVSQRPVQYLSKWFFSSKLQTEKSSRSEQVRLIPFCQNFAESSLPYSCK